MSLAHVSEFCDFTMHICQVGIMIGVTPRKFRSCADWLTGIYVRSDVFPIAGLIIVFEKALVLITCDRFLRFYLSNMIGRRGTALRNSGLAHLQKDILPRKIKAEILRRRKQHEIII